MFRNSFFSRSFPALLVIGLAIVLAQMPAANADDKSARTISLTGLGTVKAKPDTAHISTGVVSDAGSADKALTDNTQAMTKVVAGLKAQGIAGRDIRTTNFSVNPRYSRAKSGQPRAIIGYRVVNSVAITVRDIKKLGAILDGAVTVGANQIAGIRFSVAKTESLKDAAREKAMADALRKARLYVQAAGAKLGKVRTISENVIAPQPRPMMARTAFEQKADVPIEPGEQSLDVRVHVSWELE
ncbi:MAG: SIMPL domain-containing protein [Hyphomicrobiales bacterium]|nr:SIMPL domain-containing protein [Hyphomicrobiales bacterium]